MILKCVEVIEVVEELGVMETSKLHEKLNDPGLLNYVVCWMRLVASAELQNQPDFYINFLPNVVSIHDFCRQVLLILKMTLMFVTHI